MESAERRANLRSLDFFTGECLSYGSVRSLPLPSTLLRDRRFGNYDSAFTALPVAFHCVLEKEKTVPF
jgi:hypothetical protein